MTKLIARLKVFFGALPTWLVIASAVITIFSEEIASVLPAGPGETIGRIAVILLAVIGAALNIVRRVTPVIAAQRGLDAIEGRIIVESNTLKALPEEAGH